MIGEYWRRLLFLINRRRFDRDLEDEMRFHAEMTGRPQFGNVTFLQEESREMWGFGFWERLGQDLRYAVRVLRKSPGFTLIAILSLALGIGANTAIFTLINALILRSLPVQHPEQLVALSHNNLRRLGMSFPYPFYRELRDRTDLFSGVLCQTSFSPNFSVRGSTERVTGTLVSSDYFDVLGITPQVGRLFHRQDETAAGDDRVVVLSYGFWKRRFGGDPAIIGQTVTLNTVPVTVIGITPPAFSSLYAEFTPDIRVPLTLHPQIAPGPYSMLENRNDWWLTVVGRMKPGVAMGPAEAALTAALHNYMQQGATAPRSTFEQRVFQSERMILTAAATGLAGRAKNAAKQLYVLMGVVGLVLLVACANLANLLLARTAARQREIAVRLSLGAARGRIIRQLLTESLLLAGTAGVIGVLCAGWAARLLFALLMAGQQGVSVDLTPDLRVLGFTLAVSFATGILFGMAPAFRSTRFELTPELKGEPPRVAGTRIGWRKLLVSAQVALSLLLLIGAGLFLRSLANLRAVDAGFDARNVVQISLDPTHSGYTQEQVRPFFRDVAKRVSNLPGVTSAAFGDLGLIANNTWGSGIRVEGYQPKEDDPGPNRNVVGSSYFTTLRIPIVQGRDFSERDTQKSPHVAIVNERFARFYFGNQNPLGKHIGPASKQQLPADFEIVGVAKDGKYATLREETPRFWYIPYEQNREVHNLTLYVRTAGDPLKMVNTVRQAIRGVDPNVPAFNVATLEEQIDNSIATDRLVALASTFFSLLAAMIAAIGLYGVMSYAIVKRTREIGIRVALGARQSDVIGPVMGEVAVMLLIGVAVGVPAALALGRLVGSILFELKPADPAALIAACAFMSVVALVAGFFPARKASRIDPMIALRYD